MPILCEAQFWFVFRRMCMREIERGVRGIGKEGGRGEV